MLDGNKTREPLIIDSARNPLFLPPFDTHPPKKEDMGNVYADIELISSEDLTLARKYIIGEEEIKRVVVTALVDTGAFTLAINEYVQEQLQLPVLEKRRSKMADESVAELDVVGPIDIRFGNRQTTCRAVVLPGNAEILLGAIPMEDMDVVIDMRTHTMIVHPDHLDMPLQNLK